MGVPFGDRATKGICIYFSFLPFQSPIYHIPLSKTFCTLFKNIVFNFIYIYIYIVNEVAKIANRLICRAG